MDGGSVGGPGGEPFLRIAHVAFTEEVNGPGRRFTVWAQGCSRRCEGCFNPDLVPFRGGRAVRPEDLAAEAWSEGRPGGLSLSGGEPFDQAAGLSAFVDAVRTRPGGSGITVVAFTGYTVEQLASGSPGQRALLGRVDLVVDGPFLPGRAAALPLRGSGNQRLVARTAAGQDLAARARRSLPGAFQVVVAPDGAVILTGFPPPGLGSALRSRLGGP